MVGILNPWGRRAFLISSENGDSPFHCAILSSMAIASSYSFNSWIWSPLGWALTCHTNEVVDPLIDGDLLHLLLRVSLKSVSEGDLPFQYFGLVCRTLIHEFEEHMTGFHATWLHVTWLHVTYSWSSFVMGQGRRYVLGRLAFVPLYQRYAQYGLAGSSEPLQPPGTLNLGSVDVSHGF